MKCCQGFKIGMGFIEESLVGIYETKESITNTKKSKAVGAALVIKKHRIFFEIHNTLREQMSHIVGWAIEEQQLEDLLCIWGEELFLQGIYAYNEKFANMRKNYSFTKDWIRLDKESSKRIIINTFFEKFAEGTVAIYGIGDMGHLLLESLSDENKKKVVYVIDRNIVAETEYEIKSLEQLTNEDYKKLECIIITAIAHEKEIKESIRKITAVPIVSLQDIF